MEKSNILSEEMHLRNIYVSRIREAERLRACRVEGDYEDTFSIVWEIMQDSFKRGQEVSKNAK
jgi:hypothetical protein